MSLAFRAMTRWMARQRPEVLAVDGARLQRIGTQCWSAERELSYGGSLTLPVRMAVIRNQSDGLTLYSPVSLDEGTREALAGLGEVRRIIVPNRFHTRFAGRVLDAYPDAGLLVPEADGGLMERFGDRSRPVTDLQTIEPGLEVLPVHLRDGLVELCAYHDASETLLLADLMFNLQQADSRRARLAHRLNGTWRQTGTSRLQRLLLLKDEESLSRFYHWALAKPFSQIAMAHGLLITDNARETFYQVFSRYGALRD